MWRKLISFVISFYAVAFAFAALAALRLPTVAIFEAFIAGEAVVETFAGFDWRRLSILLSAPYFLAAVAFFMSAGLVSSRQPGAGKAFLLGALLGFPCLLFVEFHPEWWRDPTQIEAVTAGAGAFTLIIFGILHDLKPKPARSEPVEATAAETSGTHPIKIVRPTRPLGPPPPAIARQRALFAAHGRKMQGQAQPSIRWVW